MPPVFRLLGPLVIGDHEGGSPVRRKQREVLAALLLRAGSAISSEEFVDLLWGERPPPSARANVHTYVSGLRHAIARAAPTSGPRPRRTARGYQLDLQPGECDAEVFERLTAAGRIALAEGRPAVAAERLSQALALWRGDVLDGVERHDWLTPYAVRLEQARAAAEEDLVEARLGLGQHVELLGELAQSTAVHPLRERLHGHYIEALRRSALRAEAVRAYERLSADLGRELGVEPSIALREQYRRLTSDVAEDSAPASTAVRGRRPAPAQLPAGIPSLSGRARELAVLSDVLLGDRRLGLRICAVNGVGGIGKTSVALHWAYRNRDRFPGGQLFVDLRGFDPSGEPMPPATALRGFLDALGVAPASIPTEVDAQAGLYRSILAERRILVVLDNARDAAQLEPLLPGSAGGTVIVTSRDQLTEIVYRHGAYPLTLDVLSRAEAGDLLGRRLGRQRLTADPAAVQQVITACGGLPLALGISAARAAVAPKLSMSAIAADLADTTTRLDALDLDTVQTGLRAALATSFAALGSDLATTFALLGSAPGPDIGRPAVSALTNLPDDESMRLLRGLEQQSLLTRQGADRWRMHDLVRLYAAESASGDLTSAGRAAARHRLTDFYLHTAFAADRCFEPHRQPIVLGDPAAGVRPLSFTDLTAALSWIDAEHTNVLAVQRSAATRGHHLQVWQLAWVLDSYLRRRGRIRDLVASWRAGCAAAEAIADPALSALADQGLGAAHVHDGRHDLAAQRLGHALELSRRLGDRIAEAVTHRILARAHSHRGDDEAALRHATRALHLLEAENPSSRLANALNGVGWYAARLGRFDMAHTHLEAALALARRQRYRDAETNILDSLGYLAFHTGRHSAAVGYYQQSIELAREVGFDLNEAGTLERIGDAYAAADDPTRAGRSWQLALRLYQAQHRHVDAARIQRALAGDCPPGA